MALFRYNTYLSIYLFLLKRERDIKEGGNQKRPIQQYKQTLKYTIQQSAPSKPLTVGNCWKYFYLKNKWLTYFAGASNSPTFATRPKLFDFAKK